MKKTFNNFLTTISLFGVLFFSACEYKDDALPTQSVDDAEETSYEVDLSSTMENIDEVTMVGFQRNGFGDRSLATYEEDLCEKVTITLLPGEKKMVIDFGEGCISPRGVHRKGKMIVTYTGRYWEAGTKIKTTFDNFFVNGRKIEGTREVTNEGLNPANRSFTFRIVVEGGKITWPDGTYRTFDSRHLRNVFLPNNDRGVRYTLAGGSKGVNRLGKEYLVQISSPLVFFERCLASGNRVPSNGKMKLKVSNREEIEIDFGSMTCDKEVTITKNGESKTLTLERP